MPPKLTGILEPTLYVDDLDRSQRFYEAVFGLTQVVATDPDGHVLELATPGTWPVF